MVIPDSVTSIGQWAFNCCTGLTTVVIPDSVTSIGDHTFNGCTGLTAVVIPDSVTSVGWQAFDGCTGLATLRSKYGSADKDGRLVIPSTVTEVGERAFESCGGLTTVAIPDSVTSIGEGAFKGCTGLTTVAIPDSVTSIGEGAFEGCEVLTSVTIPDAVTSIGRWAFQGCTGLTAVAIPDSVISIEKYAFRGCTGLTGLTIPNSVASIGEDAFKGCTGLTAVAIPDQVTSIEEAAFMGCTGLTTVTIPDSVTSIEYRAFYGCTGLTAVAIPDSVTSILEESFASCARLTMVTIQDGSKVEQFDRESIIANSPFATIVDLAAEEQRYTTECPKLQMVQFSNAAALATPQAITLFDADKAKETKALIKTIPLHDAFESKTLPALLFAPAATTPAAAETAATTTALRYQQMIEAQLTLPHPDAAPLSERLSSLKDVLNICLQFELSAPPPTIYNTINFEPHMKMYVDPAVAIIKQAVNTMKGQVAADPNKYRHLLAHISTGDKHIYEECFGKTINAALGGDEATYKMMLQTIVELKTGCTLVEVHVQPTSELMPLILMVRENVPAYKAIVISAVESCSLDIRQVAVDFRHETKAPYRVIEKSLTKHPISDGSGLDCSRVLDVFGCLINCSDYVSMAAVVKAFATKHKSGELQLTRAKDRWTTPSSGGWRDLMLNLVINGVVFEVQIVHSKMLAARKGLDAHKAYNQYRSFAEVFDMLDLDAQLATVDGRAGVGEVLMLVDEEVSIEADEELEALVRVDVLEDVVVDVDGDDGATEREEVAHFRAEIAQLQSDLFRLKAMLLVAAVAVVIMLPKRK